MEIKIKFEVIVQSDASGTGAIELVGKAGLLGSYYAAFYPASNTFDIGYIDNQTVRHIQQSFEVNEEVKKTYARLIRDSFLDNGIMMINPEIMTDFVIKVNPILGRYDDFIFQARDNGLSYNPSLTADYGYDKMVYIVFDFGEDPTHVVNVVKSACEEPETPEEMFDSLEQAENYLLYNFSIAMPKYSRERQNYLEYEKLAKRIKDKQ